ncbi:MAG TPA: hypothetical protein ENK44_10955 [Caldithrix abyssi]|uniref:Tetratricopeptide repeat protein n=1 Tax=Caldithrix abyssi TaxID=187145 RepID=A0A7V4U3J7_CALAY|nr:hypothetical protein [Caldithrix abyssi]
MSSGLSMKKSKFWQKVYDRVIRRLRPRYMGTRPPFPELCLSRLVGVEGNTSIGFDPDIWGLGHRSLSSACPDPSGSKGTDTGFDGLSLRSLSLSKGTVKTALIGFMFLLIACGQQKQADIPADSRLKLANAYTTNGLYQAAVDEYLAYLQNNNPDDTRRANTYYTIANIYFERIKDYEKALEYYFRIKYLYPQSTLQGEVGKRIVSCLERLQRSTDAQRIMQQEAALDKDQAKESRPGAVLAKIGEKEITQGDLDYEIRQLPPYLQEQFKDKKKKLELLKQLIAQELLYDSAKRKGLDKDKEVIEGAFRARKALMTEKMIREELKDEVKIEPADVELYYLAHKDKYAEKDDKSKVIRQKPFEEVSQQAAQDLAMERQQQAYQKLLDRLMKAEDVRIFESRVK